MEAEKIIEVATKFREMFAPYCLKTAIGGGIRRGKPDPHDIEMVLCPDWIRQPNLLGEVEDTLVCPGLDAVITDCLDWETLVWDDTVVRRGALYKRFKVPELEYLPLEVFCARGMANWGNTLAIRTGDAHWNHALFTRRRLGGLLPDIFEHKDGALWRVDAQRRDPLACSTEKVFFGYIGVPFTPPAKRCKETAIALGAKEFLFKERVK